MKLDEVARKEYDRYIENRRYERGITKSRQLDLKYSIEEALEKGLEQGLEQGLKQGIELEREQSALKIKAEKIKTAKNLLQANLDIDFIANTTGLSILEIEKLK